MKITSLEVNNIKRIKAARIEPDGSPSVIIGGKNAQGKTSVLDAITMALAGKKALPEDPVRHGADKGEIKMKVGDFDILRTISPDGKSQLKVTGEAGKYSSPQGVLDGLCGKLSFDPLAFMRMSDADQAKHLSLVAGLDLDDVDERIKAAEEARRDAGRDAKKAAAVLEDTPSPPADAPAERVSVAEISSELGLARDAQSEVDDMARKVNSMAEKLSANKEMIQRLTDENASISADLKKVSEAQAAAAKLVPDTSALEEKLKHADELNRKYAAREHHRQVSVVAEETAADHKKWDDKVTAVRAEKAKLIAESKVPVEGLAIEDGAVHFNGVPISQSSAAEQIRISMAIGLAANPELRVILIRDGSLLDADSLKIINDQAAAADAQVWIERVGDGDEVGIVIEDGEVKEDRTDAVDF